MFKFPVLGLKGGLWIFRKSPKILTVSDQYFLSYVRKNTNCAPPPEPINEKEKVENHISVKF